MQFLSALLLAVAASVASAAALDPAYSSDLKERTDMRWCNGGTFGDHGCEDLGYHTYCCSMSASSDDFFNSPRDVIVASKNPQHGTDCANKGKVYCAK
ncbi:hypothetical protein E4U38_005531 [Claviceps purpurea]|nr:hypothetical protein E4U12_006111 [Claviceps purpurea]KAG6128743.1 hypothetical protein E4U38_005531 [Claviceps purpurea]KAG6149093.1 hypothetical protein E4U11_000301 [Claviceps purpurea]KAG6169833.1 hypothetical protein E4U51_001288 [Claviceps purpurea]KAG6225632.1 hypothetical protein E4U25_008190 [Claviceps purpurea]